MAASRPPSRLMKKPKPQLPQWAVEVLPICLVLVAAIAVTVRLWLPGAEGVRTGEPAGSAAPAPPEAPPASPVIAPTAVPAPAPAVTPEPEPESEPDPEAEPEPETAPAVDLDAWFSDAVFIGDSRVDGLRLYSGITKKASFLYHTGLTIYDVAKEKAVLKRGSGKVSVLDALAERAYGKIYISLGVNELGYFNPEGFAKTYGQVIDAIRAGQPDARVYVLSILPINDGKCRAKGVPYYITNQGVSDYNEALAELCADRDVLLLGVPEGLLDEAGELSGELTGDGVHLKTEGCVLWLDYLAAHTEG